MGVKEDSGVLVGYGSVVRHVLSMLVALGSILRTTKPPQTQTTQRLQEFHTITRVLENPS